MDLKFIFRNNTLKEKFTNIFHNNSFLGPLSISGPGSDLTQTEFIRKEIPILIKKYKVKSFMDAPCGDFFWMQYVTLDGIKYIGIDIVKEIIKNNKKKYKNTQRKFICKNIVSDTLPYADVILIRDCWVHLSNKDIFLCIKNLKQNHIKYLLTTSFTNRNSNKDLDDIWRPINLERPPFNFPKPIEVIIENCTEGDGIYSDKSLILWEISKLTFV